MHIYTHTHAHTCYFPKRNASIDFLLFIKHETTCISSCLASQNSEMSQGPGLSPHQSDLETRIRINQIRPRSRTNFGSVMDSDKPRIRRLRTGGGVIDYPTAHTPRPRVSAPARAAPPPAHHRISPPPPFGPPPFPPLASRRRLEGVGIHLF